MPPLPFVAELALTVAPQLLGGLMGGQQQQQQVGGQFPQMNLGSRSREILQPQMPQTGAGTMRDDELFNRWMRDPIMNAFLMR